MARRYGDVIKRLRELKGWSQQELAERAHISRETEGRAEQSGNVGVFGLYQLAEALGVDISAFFGGLHEDGPDAWWNELTDEQRLYLERLARRWTGRGATEPNHRPKSDRAPSSGNTQAGSGGDQTT
jgi:transcriptional regulator with XRE-family HTH domain